MFVERDGCLPKEEERKRTPPRPTSASPFITQGEVYIFRELERERERTKTIAHVYCYCCMWAPWLGPALGGGQDGREPWAHGVGGAKTICAISRLIVIII
jgi:hypothetical protein